MKVLALETSTEFCSAALWLDGRLSVYSELAGQRHSELLVAMLDKLLGDSGLRPAHLDGVAFGMGPGSFTGVRIACGVAQGLALGADLPVAGVCTLQALAQASGRDRVIAALDARMNEIYLAAYVRQSGLWRVACEPQLCVPHDAPRVAGSGWFGAGSAFALYGPALGAQYADQLDGVAPDAVPQAGAVAECAIPVFEAGLGQDAAYIAPMYLRDKVALKSSERPS